MKQIKILVALASTLIVPLTAQADDGTVTLYGQIRLSVDQTDNGQDDGVSRVSNGESRLGVKGSEALGNGLKAIFQFESNVNLDDGNGGNPTSGTLFGTGRDSYAGLAGGFGTVVAGIINTPYRTSTDSFDIFDNSVADYNTIIGEVGNRDTRAEFNRREPNTLNYWSPKFEKGLLKSFAFKAQIRPDEVAGIDQNRYSISGVYDNGPLLASLAYERHNREATVTIDDVVTPTFDTEGFKAGLAYKFNGNNTRVGVVYENLSQDGTGIFDRDAWYVSASHKLGINVLKFAYGHANENESTDDSGADFVVIGATHNLSRRSEIYALYTRTDNESNGRYGLGASSSGAVAAASAGADLDSFSLGVIHKF